MEHNDGREPTDAELMMALARQYHEDVTPKYPDLIWARIEAAVARGDKYLSGTRPAPAPDEVAQLRAEVVEQSATINRQYELLKGVANVLKGQAGETELWSHADLPEMATRLTARVAELEAAGDDLFVFAAVFAAGEAHAAGREFLIPQHAATLLRWERLHLGSRRPLAETGMLESTAHPAPGGEGGE